MGTGRVRRQLSEGGAEAAGCPAPSLARSLCRPRDSVRYQTTSLWSETFRDLGSFFRRPHLIYSTHHVTSRKEKYFSGSQLLSGEDPHTCCYAPGFSEEGPGPKRGCGRLPDTGLGRELTACCHETLWPAASLCSEAKGIPRGCASCDVVG